VASMGPRSGERGNRMATEVWNNHIWLQWGRAQVSAEIARDSRKPLRRQCFNGAALR